MKVEREDWINSIFAAAENFKHVEPASSLKRNMLMKIEQPVSANIFIDFKHIKIGFAAAALVLLMDIGFITFNRKQIINDKQGNYLQSYDLNIY